MNEKAMAVYRGILSEIKYRTEAIDGVLNGQIPLRAKIAEELCYLQLRMICELIAIGCLVIHERLSPLKADLFKTYKADWIMKELAKLHPRFFPVPLENEDEPGSDPPQWVQKKNGYLTQDGLAQLWHTHAGNALHRGSARNILEKDKPLDFNAIRGWRNKIVTLLTRHIIHSPDDEFICYFVMNARNHEGKVASNLFKKAGLWPPTRQ